jgi:hypothetical protein
MEPSLSSMLLLLNVRVWRDLVFSFQKQNSHASCYGTVTKQKVKDTISICHFELLFSYLCSSKSLVLGIFLFIKTYKT